MQDRTLLKFVKGPDFPTGGIIVDDQASIAEAYKTGRGGFRVRARWEKEEGARGVYQIVVTEIPYQVQKSKLIERIAELLEQKKLPLLDDVHDESAEDIRIVLTPKSRAVDADLLMEQLFRPADLEARIPLNMNVLDGGLVPKVMSLKEALQAFIAHRREVLERRSGIPAGKDRRPAGSAGGLSRRLSQPRQGDQDHPHRGRAEAETDEGVRAQRDAGRSHPQHAAALPAQAGRDGNPRRA